MSLLIFEYIVILHKKISINVALEFAILVGNVIRGKNQLDTIISKVFINKILSFNFQ